MAAALSLKALAEQVLAGRARVEHHSGTPVDHPQKKWNTGVVRRSTTRPTRSHGGPQRHQADVEAHGLSIHVNTAVSAGMKTLCWRMRQTRDWDDLGSLLADADVAYVNGELTGEEVDCLCQMAIQESRCLPEKAPPRRSNP